MVIQEFHVAISNLEKIFVLLILAKLIGFRKDTEQ